MRSLIILLYLHFALLFSVFAGSGYTITIRLSRLPDSRVFLASIRGDAFKIIDTADLKNNLCTFTMSDYAQPGMYRILPENALSQSRRNAPTSTLDFIFNHENVSIQTVFPWIQDSLNVLESKENKVFYGFLDQENKLQVKLDLLQNMLIQYPAEDELYGSLVKRYNSLQKEKLSLIRQTCDTYKDSFAAALIAMHKTPFLDPLMSEAEQQEYARQHYFDSLDYSNSDLIHSNAYTHTIVRYLMLYRNPALSQHELENEFMKASDVILKNTGKNPEVYDFVLNYLLEGFERLKMDNVLKYIADHYMNTVCTTDESSTLLRRMGSYSRLAVGMQAPDISIRNSLDREIRLSAIERSYVLVVFWASWCPNCEEMMPKLNAWYRSRSLDLEILAVSLDTTEANWNKAIENFGLNFLNGCDLKGWSGKAASDYSVYATPSLFLLDRNRIILAKPVSYDDFLKTVNGLKTR
jgi:peroxiredoxin